MIMETECIQRTERNRLVDLQNRVRFLSMAVQGLSQREKTLNM